MATMARVGGLRASVPLIATKLAIPLRRGDTLRRPRLVDALQQVIDRQLLLVVAPAGYGKTTLLTDFASDSAIPICWYALGPADAEPAIFLEYLVAAIQARFPRFGSDTRRAMAHANFRTDAMAVAATLVHEIQERIPDYFAVVLDDYHEINHSAAINQVVDALLIHAPENFKLIVSSRTMPKLQLSRLASLRRAAGVGAKDLRFTSNEVRDLMREAYHTVLPDRVVEELTIRSEGWITGIILTSHTMWQGLFESMIRNSGQEQLYDYLAGKVFERQTPEVQRFLLASSILDDMEPAVAGALAGASRADDILRRLEEGNLFVSELEGRKPVYRFHHLFRDFLRARLGEGAQGLARPGLERRAGRHYQRRGRHEQAIGHLLAAGAFEEAAGSILKIAEDAFNLGRIETLAGWIDRLPEELFTAQPRLALWRGQIALQRGEYQTAIEDCEQVEARASAIGDPVLAAEAVVQRAEASRLLGDAEHAIGLCERALTLLGPDTTGKQAPALRTMGAAEWRLGHLVSAREHLCQAHTLFEEAGDEVAAAYVQIDLGTLAVLLGRLAEARQRLSLSAQFWQGAGNAGQLSIALSSLGGIAALEEDYANAIDLLERAVEQANVGLWTIAEGAAACSMGALHRDLGQFEEAGLAFSRAHSLAIERADRAALAVVLNSMGHSLRLQGLHAEAEAALRRARVQASSYELAQIRLTAGMCAVERGSNRRAASLLGHALDAFRASGARYDAARCLLHLALNHDQRGNRPRSDAALTECLAILEELGYAQFLAVDGPRCRDFLERAVARGIGENLLDRLLVRLDQQSYPLSPVVGRQPKSHRPRLGVVRELASRPA